MGPANLDPASPIPLYRQLRAALETAIADGEYINRKLPSTRALATELGVSRNTANLAYQELAAEGYITAQPKSGFWVNGEMRQLLITRRTRADAEVPRKSVPRWPKPAGATGPADQLPHIVKPADWHDYPYVFLGGQFDPDLFPRLAWLRSLRDALEPGSFQYSLQDSQSSDDPFLIEKLCTRVLPLRGIVPSSRHEVLVTMGSQHGLFLIAEAIVRHSSVVAIEDPGYTDAKHIMLRAGAVLVPVPVDESGLTMTRELETADVVYVTPSHQFPTNVTLSIARRRHLLELAQHNDSFIIEDDYDSEFRYLGSPTPSLKAMDRSGHVIYVGSFSKFLAPGLRMGFIVAHADLIADLRDRRRYMLRHPPGHIQRALGLLIDSGEYSRAVRRARAAFKDKWQRMADAVRQHLWDMSPPAGGLSLWLRGPGGLDTRQLAGLARQRGVLLEPGDTFFSTSEAPGNYFRLGFSAIPAARIAPGIELLGKLVEETLGSQP